MKKLLILFMPFFMVCCKSKKQPPLSYSAQRDSIVALTVQLKTPELFDSSTLQAKWDALAGLGKRFKWDGIDSNFRSFIAINDVAGDLLWKKNRKECIDYFHNVTQYESTLQSDTLPRYFWNNFYKLTAEAFSFQYNENIVTDFERCYFIQQHNQWLSPKKYFNTLQNLGISYHILGEKNKALNYYSLALHVAPLTNNPNDDIASASINRYGYFLEYNQPDAVIAHAPTVLMLKNVDLKRIAMIKAYYAEALYATNDPLYSIQLHEALDSLQKIPQDEVDEDILGKKSDVLKLYGNIYLLEKKYPTAIVFYKNALDTCLKKNDSSYKDRSYGKLLLKLAAVYDSLGQYDTALYYSQFALASVTQTDKASIASNPALTELYPENTIMEALDSKARLLEKKYLYAKDSSLLKNAITCYELSFAVEQKLLDNFTYDDSREHMQQVSKARSGRAINACYQLYALTGENIWAEKAFRFSENSKALILLEAIKKNISKSENKDNPFFKRVDSLRLQLAYTERLLFEEKKGDSTVMARKDVLKKALDDALTDLDNRGLGYKKYQQAENTDLLGDLRKKLLTDNRYLAEFFWTDSNRYLFVVKKTGNLVFKQLDNHVAQSIEGLMRFFTGKDQQESKDYKEAAYQLFQASGLAATLDAKELLIIPDGPFNLVPFDALVTKNDGNSGYISMDYLFFKITTSYGYSATSLLKQTDNHKTGNGPAVAFAPVFDAGERNMRPLRNSKAEVDSIDVQLRYIGNQSTVGNLRQSFATAGTIHIASHASADMGTDGNPKIEMYDSAFYMNELYATSLLHTNLVVLSACQTNQGNINQSEGTLSLARGFYYAGAKNIVASLWNVDDKSTAKMIQLFYKSNKGVNYAAKLRDAKKIYLSSQGPGGKIAPYYWAALMHIGGFDQPEANNYWWIYVTGAALLLALGFLYQKRRKRLG